MVGLAEAMPSSNHKTVGSMLRLQLRKRSAKLQLLLDLMLLRMLF
jgi:hypothetical protein